MLHKCLIKILKILRILVTLSDISKKIKKKKKNKLEKFGRNFAGDIQKILNKIADKFEKQICNFYTPSSKFSVSF